jgi:chaperone modulatory protein CbpM
MTSTIVNITFEELCQIENISPEVILDIIDYGIVTPVSGSSKSDWSFDIASIVWFKKAVILYKELDIDWIGIAMIIELLKQKQNLILENQSLRRRLDQTYYTRG